MPTEMPLTKSILVIGASGCIGSEIARSLALAGFAVGLPALTQSTDL